MSEQDGLDLISNLFTQKKLTDNYNSVEMILKKIQGEVVMKRVRVKEFFKDYDPLRKGIVT